MLHSVTPSRCVQTLVLSISVWLTLTFTLQLIIAILALTKGELRIVQASMLGSILSNCLLVLGEDLPNYTA